MFNTKLNKIRQVPISLFIIKPSLLNFMKIPHHIHTQRIQSHRLYHPNTMLPVLNRNSGVMDLPSKDLVLEVLGKDGGETLVMGAVME